MQEEIVAHIHKFFFNYSTIIVRCAMNVYAYKHYLTCFQWSVILEEKDREKEKKRKARIS